MMSVFYHKKQKRVRALFCLALLGGLLVLGACGKKPSHVDPPEGEEEGAFQVYPDLKNDPQP